MAWGSIDRNLKSPEEMERRFAGLPDAIQASADVVDECRLDLGEIRYQYSCKEATVGHIAQRARSCLTEEGGRGGSCINSPVGFQ